MGQVSSVRFVTDGTYSVEQARVRLEAEGVLTRDESGWKWVSDDPSFPTVHFLATGLIEMHGQGLQDHERRVKLSRQLAKLLGVGVQPAGEV